MSFINKKNCELLMQDKVTQLNNNLDKYLISKNLDENIKLFSQLFKKVETIKTRKITNEHNLKLNYYIIYCEGLIDAEIINDNIIRPLILSKIKKSKNNFLGVIEKQILQANGIKKVTNVKDIVESITYGETALFIDGFDKVFVINTQKFTLRSITEPENEKILMGPREGFNESILFNISMLHRRLRTNDFKVEYKTIGKRSNTKIALCYMNSVVRPELLEQLNKRLKQIDIDGIIDSNYIIELIKDNKLSPFRTIGNTERPDVVIGKILEGRIAILVDGTPMALTLPYLFIENFQSSEDYNLGFYYTSFSRIIRMFGFFITCNVPALYIAVVAFHHEMLPTSLFLNITMERQSVPLPAALEAFIMLFVFEILRETGVRMPTGIGQTLSIVGALVIGQAAVAAKLVAAPMIIVVGIAGITSLLTPKMNAASLTLRFTILSMASMFGLFGFLIMNCFWIIHTLNLESFGVKQINYLEKGWKKKAKDNIIRMPWTKLNMRPFDIANQNNLIRNSVSDGDKNV